MPDQKKPAAPEPGKALELVPKEQRALMQTASDVGALVIRNGLPFLDLSQPAITERYNVLAPSMIVQQVSPNFTPYLSELRFNPSEDGIYPIDKRWDRELQKEVPTAVGLGKRQLMLIAKAMGATIRSKVWVDAHGNRFAEAEFETRRIDGTLEVWPGSRAWIKADEYEKLVEQCPETKWEGKGQGRRQVPMTEADREKWIKTNWIRVREMSLAMTETKAIERAIRASGAIPTKVPVEVLNKSFLVLSTVFTPDANNVQIQLSMIEKGQQAAQTLYGTPAGDKIVHQPAWEQEDEPEGRPPNVDADGVIHSDAEEAEVIEGEVVEEGGEQSQAAPARGPKPDDDRGIPAGPYQGKMVSDVCRDDPTYAREKFLHAAPPLGPLTEDWLRYWGNFEDGGEFDGVKF